MKQTGDILRMLRQQKGWSQEDLAYELHMSLTGYSKIERNITDITLSRIVQLAEIFEIRPYELLAMSEDASESSYKKILEERDKEIMRLQQKVIELLVDRRQESGDRD